MARTLDDKVVAVVGATGGLGSPICDALAGRGAHVVRASRTSEIAIDIRDADAGDLVVQGAVGRHGRLDGVVIASGAVAFEELLAANDVIAEELVLVNALGPMWLARRVAPELIEREGFLLAITGVVAQKPQPRMSAYSASKAALSAGLSAIRFELRRDKVSVIEVSPPHTETGLATRPLAGSAPEFPTGLDPANVAERIVQAIEGDERQVLADEFG